MYNALYKLSCFVVWYSTVKEIVDSYGLKVVICLKDKLIGDWSFKLCEK